jgi:hypothetical protein
MSQHKVELTRYTAVPTEVLRTLQAMPLSDLDLVLGCGI